jgi:hypothetical protein
VSLLSDIRQRLNRVGSDQGQIELLRRLLASTEDPKMLRAIAAALEEVRDYAPDDVLPAVADLRDRLHAKTVAIGAGLLPTPRRPKCVSSLRDGGHSVAPSIKMVISDWCEDEYGNRSRQIYADPDGPEWHA